MKDDRKGAIKKLRTLIFTQKSETEKFRDKIEKTFSQSFVPNRVECITRECGGIKCDFLNPDAYASDKIIIYVHGGSFVGGSRDSYRSFCAGIANVSSCKMIVPEFRLPPAGAFPAGIEDLESVFRSFFIQDEVEGHFKKNRGFRSATQIILMADGSGASLAFALLQKLNKENLSRIKSVILFSPWLDFSQESGVLADKKAKDEVLSSESIRRSIDAYTYSSNHENPLVSPAFIEDEKLKLLPHVYIQCGSKELLLTQYKEFAATLKSLGVEYTLDIQDGMMFMFQMADEYLNESHLALERVGLFIKERRGLSEEEIFERDLIMKKNNIYRE